MNKVATVSARMEESTKIAAENILQELGIPVSVVINSLYRQIIIQRGIPFSMTLVSQPNTIEAMTKNQLDNKLEHSYAQAIARQGRPLNAVFDDLERKHL